MCRIILLLCIMLIQLVSTDGHASDNPSSKEKENMSSAQKAYRDLCAAADESVEQVRELTAQDPLRPLFHVTAASRFINDPNGPVYFNGLYHLFFQHLPFYPTEVPSVPYWGHAVSPDLVHWSHWPIAIAPVPDSYDAQACASGSCVINNGVPTIVYTSVPPQAQSLAMSTDNLRTWIRYEGNPVIATTPAVKDLEDGFRDPFVWKEKTFWYMAVGSGIKAQGGTILLYRSPDLIQWEYLRQLCTGMGPDCFQWECPNFFRLKDRHVLIVSPLYHSIPSLRGPVQYAIGKYADHTFDPGKWQLMDLGGPENFYAPNSLVDQKGRRIMWGWTAVPGSPGYPWHGVITLPRVLTIRTDGTLGMKPLPELKALRGRHWRFKELSLENPGNHPLENTHGNCLEILINVEASSDAIIGFDVLASDDFKQYIPIRIDRVRGILKVGDRESAFQQTEQEKTFQFHLFVDRSVLELYVNDRICFTSQARPKPEDQNIRLVAESGRATFKTVDVWEMTTIWPSDTRH